LGILGNHFPGVIGPLTELGSPAESPPNFTAIPNGTALFVDANPFVYHFAPGPRSAAVCRQLLERVAQREVTAFTSMHVLSDVAHRLMTLEAMRRFGWAPTGIANRLRRHPAEVQALTAYRQALTDIVSFGVHVLAPSPPLILSATAHCQQYGLLMGDALIVEIMQSHGLTHLASGDADFDRVPGLTRYAPA
jgi:predicted nucleic acid-binding protein